MASTDPKPRISVSVAASSSDPVSAAFKLNPAAATFRPANSLQACIETLKLLIMSNCAGNAYSFPVKQKAEPLSPILSEQLMLEEQNGGCIVRKAPKLNFVVTPQMVANGRVEHFRGKYAPMDMNDYDCGLCLVEDFW